MVSLDVEGAQEIIHRWSPFNQTEPPVTHMRDLYPNYFSGILVYMNKEAFQSVAKDEMFICNHDFNDHPN